MQNRMNTRPRPTNKETHLDWKWAIKSKGLRRARPGVVIYLDQSKLLNAERDRRERWMGLIEKK